MAQPPLGKPTRHSRIRRIMVARQEETAAPARAASAIFSGDTLEALQPHFERAIGVIIWTIGYIGTVMTFNGAWSRTPSLAAFLMGTVAQLLLTSVEWMYRRQRSDWRYITAVAIDAGLSINSYAQVAVPPLTGVLVGLVPGLEPRASLIAWLIVGIIVVEVAITPEKILVD